MATPELTLVLWASDSGITIGSEEDLPIPLRREWTLLLLTNTGAVIPRNMESLPIAPGITLVKPSGGGRVELTSTRRESPAKLESLTTEEDEFFVTTSATLESSTAEEDEFFVTTFLLDFFTLDLIDLETGFKIPLKS